MHDDPDDPRRPAERFEDMLSVLRNAAAVGRGSPLENSLEAASSTHPGSPVDPASVALPASPPQTHQLALEAEAGVAALAEGRFVDALTILRAVVEAGGATPVTALNLAIAEDRAGDRHKARALMQSIAVQIPEWDEPVLRLAESLRADNDFGGAEEAYRHVLTLQPNRPAALIALGGLLLRRQECEETRELLLRCCGVAPNNPEAWFVLGLAIQGCGEPGRALSAFIRAQELAPDSLTFLLCGADVAMQAGEAEAELARLEQRCAQNPLNYVPLAGMAVLLDRLGRTDAAIDAMEAATILAPDEPAPAILFGGMLARTTQIARAEAALRRARQLAPDQPQVANDHAAVLMKQLRHAEARRILLELDRDHPRNPSTLCNLANATVYLGLQEEAVAIARRAIAVAPSASLPRRTLCNVLPYRALTTPAELREALAVCAAGLARPSLGPLRNNRDPNRRLRLGLLSGSFRSHPVGWLTVAGFETLDPAQFEIVCFSRAMAGTDPLTARFKALAAEWVEVDRLSDTALAEAVRAREVDILIDLGGYGDGGRMAACAARLAPVQVKWVGMQNHSTGIPEMDWFLTDRWETPPGLERLYTERLLRLPNGYVCYSPPSHAPDVQPLPALANGFVTFGCFNNLAKITPLVIRTWSTILRRVPDARLVLKSHPLTDAEMAGRVHDAFAALGISPARILLQGPSGHRAFMRAFGGIDIALDPFPYSGGLTTCEALWMGVPTIALPGKLFSARHSMSHLSNAGLADWVVPSIVAYVDMAVARASDLRALAELHDGLREHVRRSPLCDAPRFGRALGAALRDTWQDWCAQG